MEDRNQPMQRVVLTNTQVLDKALLKRVTVAGKSEEEKKILENYKING